MSINKRPDPDKLLNKLKHTREISNRGILKIFFGACAGVGKTYAMLNDARHRFEEGTDVIIGVVETHGRDETAKLLEHLPQLPRKKVQHRGIEMDEFDLDAAIARKPSLILMDELAHTNAPGSRHPKRWQDVEELLTRGIDVYTTLNVQHLESLNDMVTRITGILVRETVPDLVFDQANHIALVDIPTDEILKRLRDGKVYLAEHVQKRASEHFFKKRNLLALRELALRRTAERVDAQMDIENASQGIRDVILSEKLLVCVGHDMLSTRVIRHARRLATRMKVPWYAVYVETSRHYRLSEKARESIHQNMQLAEKMGARTHTLKGDNAVEEILSFAYENGITCILVGRRHKGWLRNVITGTLAEQLIGQSKSIEISVITENAPRSSWRVLLPPLSGNPSGFVYATLVAIACTLLALPLKNSVDPSNLIMLYLIGTVAVAAKFGIAPSLVASFLSVAAFNFFFITPYHTFQVHDASYYFTFFAMLFTSIVMGSMASRLRLQARFYHQKEQEQSQLFALAKALSASRGHDSMAATSAKYIGEVFNAIITVWYPDEQNILHVISDNNDSVDFREASAATWAFENNQEAGFGTNTLPSVKGFYLPLMIEDKVIGVMGIIPARETRLGGHDKRLLEAFATIVASSLQRANKANEAEQRRVEMESEKLRNVLLSSVSHDLRTPLASITGLSSSLLLSGMTLPTKVSETLRSIHEQSSRLAKIVANLLDVSSLESGKVVLNKQPYFLEEVIGSALLRLEELLKNCQLENHITTGQLVHMDGLLIEQVFINLLENAVKYAGDHAKIHIAVSNKAYEMEITVSDNGPGIPKNELSHVFEKFYKGPQGGVGLGLPICKAIIEVHGGRMWVNHSDMGGASFSFTLPK